MHKELAEKDLVVRVQPSLFKKFQKKCAEDYKTVSQVIREMMLRYVNSKNEKNEKNEKETRKDE